MKYTTALSENQHERIKNNQIRNDEDNLLLFPGSPTVPIEKISFFNIGRDHYYFDDYANEDILQQIAARSFIPANRMLLDLVNQYKGKFKIAFSISGVALEQLEVYAPEVIDGFRELSKTGNVEFLTETYAIRSPASSIRRSSGCRMKNHYGTNRTCF